MSRLLHYSEKKLRFSRRHKYEDGGAYKPLGFWVSVEGELDWREWCKAESFRNIDRCYIYETVLAPAANILRIDNLRDIDLLHRRLCEGHDARGFRADWAGVMREHDGLIIAPYQWPRRHQFMWYYGWDCASGVVWNLKAIASVTLVSLPQPRR